METLRIAFVADRVAPHYTGGYERHIDVLANSLGADHCVTIFSAAPPGTSEQSRARHVRIAPSWAYTRRRGGHSLGQAAWYAASVAARLPRLGNFDFVDILGIPYIQMPLLRPRGLLEGWRWGATIWEAWHDYAYLTGVFRGLSVRAFRLGLKVTIEGNHPIIVGSRQTARALMSLYGVGPERIQWCPPGVNFASIDPCDRTTDGPEVTYVGRLESYKRVSDLIRALVALREAGIVVRASIIGEGSARPGLMRQASEGGVSDSVTFHGYVDEETKDSLLKRTEVFVMPSEREGFSIATLEAIAAGACPLIARPFRDEEFGAGDLITGFEGELTYPAGDFEALAGKIQYLLEQAPERLQLARQIRVQATQFDIRNLTNRYVQMVRHGPQGVSE